MPMVSLHGSLDSLEAILRVVSQVVRSTMCLDLVQDETASYSHLSMTMEVESVSVQVLERAASKYGLVRVVYSICVERIISVWESDLCAQLLLVMQIRDSDMNLSLLSRQGIRIVHLDTRH